MLTWIRGATGGIIVKAFLVLLAGSFAVWGVADVFNGSNDQTLAKVGEREIGAQEFRNVFDRQIRQRSNRNQQALTTAQARQLGLDRQILGDLIRSSALDEQARKLKMSLSPAFVAAQIAQNPAYQGSDGKFSASALRYRLQNAQISEGEFVANEKSNLIRSAITGAITDGLNAPNEMVELVSRQFNAKRDVKYIVLSGDKIKITQPTDKQVETFYKENPNRFSISARRVFELIIIDALSLGKNEKITDERITQLYNQQKSRFGKAESRTIEQIPFANVADAKAALEKIKGGASFEAISKERGQTDTDRLLGTFSKGNVPDASIRDVAFALKQGAVSEPIKGALSTFLIRVTKISPESFKTIAEVRPELVETLQRLAGREKVLAIRDKVEDERGAGTAFKEIAKELGLEYKLLPATDRVGRDANGNQIEGITDWGKILKTGYNTEVGLEIDPISTIGDGYTWLNVKEVIPSHTEKFADAKEKAKTLWIANEKRKALTKKALEIQKTLEGGKTLEEIAAAEGVEVQSKLGIDRRTTSADFDSAAVQAVFKVAPDGYATALSNDGKTALVIKSSPVLLPPFDIKSAESIALKKQLDTLIANDVFSAYMVDLQKSIGVQINEGAWSRVFQTN